jgi:hypothetical protein
MLYVLLFLDGITNIIEGLVKHQQLEPITLGEPGNQTFAMLVSAAWHVRSDASVKHAIAPVRHHVNECGHPTIKQGICDQYKPFFLAPPQDVGGRDKPGHDSEDAAPPSGKASSPDFLAAVP